MTITIPSLHHHLIEHLNAEIVLNTITDVIIALEWLKSTFLYIRILKNSLHYGMLDNLFDSVIRSSLTPELTLFVNICIAVHTMIFSLLFLRDS